VEQGGIWFLGALLLLGVLFALLAHHGRPTWPV
jgi:hypothetical protein